MRRLQLAFVSLTMLTGAGLAACGDQPAATTPDSPTSSSSAAPTTEELVVGVWTQVGFVQEGVLETPQDEEHFIVVLHEDGTGAFVFGPGEPPDLDALCDRETNLTWTVSKAGTALEVDDDLVWRIVTLDESSFTFEEGSSEFIHERIGRCG